jgi:hypothetical protein
MPDNTTTLRKLAVDWEMLEHSSGRPRDWRHHDLLDTETGQVVFLDEETVRRVREGTEDRLMAPWQRNDVELARQVLSARPGRYVPIPVPIDGWDWYTFNERRVRQWLTAWMRDDLGIEPLPPPRQR